MTIACMRLKVKVAGQGQANAAGLTLIKGTFSSLGLDLSFGGHCLSLGLTMNDTICDIKVRSKICPCS